RATGNRLCASLDESSGDEASAGPSARAVDARERYRHRNSADDGHDGADEHGLDERVPCRRGPRGWRTGVEPVCSRQPAVRALNGYGVTRAAATVMSGLSLRKLFSPMPRTFIRSSGFLKLPFFCRYSMIRSAVALPMPGSASSCAAVAEFRL